MLGNSIEKIAWHKAGIMKPGSQVFTVPQPESAIKVLKNRSIERHVRDYLLVYYLLQEFCFSVH